MIRLVEINGLIYVEVQTKYLGYRFLLSEYESIKRIWEERGGSNTPFKDFNTTESVGACSVDFDLPARYKRRVND